MMKLISWLKLAAMTAPATTVAQLDGSETDLMTVTTAGAKTGRLKAIGAVRVGKLPRQDSSSAKQSCELEARPPDAPTARGLGHVS